MNHLVPLILPIAGMFEERDVWLRSLRLLPGHCFLHLVNFRHSFLRLLLFDFRLCFLQFLPSDVRHHFLSIAVGGGRIFERGHLV